MRRACLIFILSFFRALGTRIRALVQCRQRMPIGTPLVYIARAYNWSVSRDAFLSSGEIGGSICPSCQLRSKILSLIQYMEHWKCPRVVPMYTNSLPSRHVPSGAGRSKRILSDRPTHKTAPWTRPWQQRSSDAAVEKATQKGRREIKPRARGKGGRP